MILFPRDGVQSARHLPCEINTATTATDLNQARTTALRIIMPTVDYLARYWLSPANGSFWKWSDDGEVVCWADGSTLVFRRELAAIVRSISDSGLPPANALLLLLGACRPHWRRPPERLGELGPFLLTATMDERVRWLRLLSKDLDRIAARAGDRMPTAHKAALAQAVFEEAGEQSAPEVAGHVLTLLEGSSTDLFYLRDDEWETRDDWWPDLRWLRYGLERFDVNRLEEFSRTGLDRLPLPADEVTSPEFETVRDLLAALENDAELAGLVRLTRRMMAAISLPRAVSDPDELPVGGVSDIANRGAFDKLLLSELASDPDVLMTRVALNEALYLRRESPPRMPPESRLILIDSGIRMWGLPRIFATATSLALAASADANTEVRILTADGKRLRPVTLTSREDLVAHMEWLATDAHPGNSLGVLEEELAEHDSSGVILVTSPDVLADPEFRRCLDAAAFPECHVAAVSRSGDFELSVRRAGGSKAITTLQLELESILEPPAPEKRPRPIVREELDPTLPALLSVDPFPFLLPHCLQENKVWQCGQHGILAISHDRRLTLWTGTDRGPKLLLDGLPPGELIWRHCDLTGNFSQFVLRHDGQLRLVTVDLPDGNCEITELQNPLPRVQRICRFHKLMLIGGGQVAVLDRQNGEIESVLKLPRNAVSVGGRFFKVGSRLQALGPKALTVGLDDVLPPAVSLSTCRAFDCLAERGPVIMQYDGTLVRHDGEVLVRSSAIPLNRPLGLVDPLGDGSVVAIHELHSDRTAIVNLKTRRVTMEQFPWRLAAAPDLSSFVWDQSLITRIRAFTLKSGYLGFQTGSGQLWDIATEGGDSVRARVVTLNFTRDERRSVLTVRRRFSSLQRVAAPAGVRWKLRVATSADGSRIFADSRGLIHLQSSDSELPEISLAINAEGSVAAWASDGLLAGVPGFLAPGGLVGEYASKATDERLRELLREFVARIRSSP